MSARLARASKWLSLSALAPLFVLTTVEAAVRDIGAYAPSWSQPFANAAGTSAVAVEGCRADPEERWRRFVGEILRGPLVAEGVVYVLAVDPNGVWLRALDEGTGEERAAVRVGKERGLHLVLQRGRPIVVGDGKVRVWELTGERLRSKIRRKAPPAQSVLATDEFLVLAEHYRASVLDLEERRAFEFDDFPGGRPAVWGGILLRGYAGPLDRRVDSVHLGGVQIPSDEDEEPRPPLFRPVGTFGAAQSGDAFVIAFRTPRNQLRVFVRSERQVQDRSGASAPASIAPYPPWSPGELSPIAFRPVVREGVLFGFGADGSLRSHAPGEPAQVLLAPSELPDAARAVDVTLARNTLYAGTFAFDVVRREVLWSRPDLDASSVLVPSAHGRFLYVSQSRELVSCGSEATIADAASLALEPVPDAPDAGEGLILLDGTYVAGSVARQADEFLVRSEGGETRRFRAGEVAWVGGAEGSERLDGELPVWIAWRRALYARQRNALEQLLGECLEQRAPDVAIAVLKTLSSFEFDPERNRAWAAAAMSTTPAPEEQLERATRRLARRAEEVNAAYLDRLEGAARWCTDHGFPCAAATLLAEAENRGLTHRKAVSLARRSMPPETPRLGGGSKAEVWLDWGRELLWVDGRFVPDSDPAAEAIRASGGEWEESVIVHNDRALVASTNLAPSIVGLALRNADGAARFFEAWLGPLPASATPSQVRLYASTSHWSAECSAAGEVHAGRSICTYSYGDGIVRLNAPEGIQRYGDMALHARYRLLRALVHQHFDARSTAAPLAEPVREPAWFLEGLAALLHAEPTDRAEYRRTFGSPDLAVYESVRTLVLEDRLLPLRELLATDASEVETWRKAIPKNERLADGDALLLDTDLGRFQQEAAALVGFLLHHAGEQAREGLAAIGRAAFVGEPDPEPWKTLGFASVDALESAWLEFVRERPEVSSDARGSRSGR